MGRKAVRMELIGGGSTRAATFKKRKSSLLKKAEELSIYCGIEVCFAVSKGPHDPAPEAWPSLEVVTKMVSQSNKHDKKLARKVAELQFQVQQIEEENQDLQAKIDSSISKLVPLIEPEAGKCVVPATEQPDLFDIAYGMDMDMEEFVYGRQPDITEWKGVDDCLEPLIGPEAGNCVVPATEQPDLFDIAYDMDMDMEEFVYGRQPDITEWKGIDDCLEPLIGPEAGNCVVPATEQPDLFDIAYDMDMDMEEFVYGCQPDITEWKGIDDCLLPFLQRSGLVDVPEPEDMEQVFKNWA